VNYGETGDLFVYPIRVALNIYGDICVSDNLRHSVTIFEKNGKINSIYYGQKSTDDLGRNSVQDSPRSQIRVSRNNGGDDIVSRRGSDGDFEEPVITARSGKTPKGTPIARGLPDPEKEMNPFDPRGFLTEEGFFFTSSAFIYLYTLIVAFPPPIHRNPLSSIATEVGPNIPSASVNNKRRNLPE
jgi:hypothetical protein